MRTLYGSLVEQWGFKSFAKGERIDSRAWGGGGRIRCGRVAFCDFSFDSTIDAIGHEYEWAEPRGGVNIRFDSRSELWHFISEREKRFSRPADVQGVIYIVRQFRKALCKNIRCL